MKKIRLFLTGLLLVASATMFAQNIRVAGTVTDASNGELIFGASVLLQGNTSTYALTDEGGRFEITVPSDGILVVDFLGYKTATIPVNGRAQIEIALEPDVQHLEDVIVVAYGASTKSAFTGSAAMVKSEKIEKRVATNVTSALSGTTPGVQVISSSGDPASNGGSIRIRGIGSMSASSSPLYILDGMPYNGSISDINASDVESMSVLKDASASAIYGARGANGVVIITTKKAAGNNLPNVKFDARFGVNSRLVPQYDIISDPAEYYETYYKMMFNSQYYAGKSVAASYDFANSNIFNSKNGGLGYQVYTVPEGQTLIGTNFKLNPNATLGYSDGEYTYLPDNWYDETIHNSFRQEYNLSVSGSAEKLSYYASVGVLDDGGIVNNSNYKRYTGRINAEYQAKKWMKFVTNMAYSHSDSQSPSYSAGTFGSSGNVFYLCNNIGPIYPLYVRDAEGNIMVTDGRIQYDANQTNFVRPNFVGNAVRDNEYNRKQNYADVLTGKWGVVFTPMKGLTLTANLGLMNDNTRYNALYSPFGSSSSTDGSAYASHSRTFSVNTQYLAEYKTDFNGSNSNFSILAGYEQFKVKSQGISGENTNLFNAYIGELNNADGHAQENASSSTSGYMTEGFLSRAQYDYDQKYFISASYRRDASSRFAKGHRWGNFGSVGAAWALTAEDFMSNVTWLDLLKVKASWGVQGNDNIGSFPYSDQYTHSYNETTGEYSVKLSYKGNENLTWESSHSINAGVDFGMFNGRLNGSFEWFNRITSDLLYSKKVPLSAGNPTGQYPINVGSISNMGYELTLDGVLVRTKNLEWDLNLNLTSYKNKILSLDESVAESGIKYSNSIVKVGGSLQDAYMRKFAGVDQETGEGLYYKKVMDENGNWTGESETTKVFTEASQYELGTILPKLYGGFGTSLSAYGFDISLQFAFQLGGKYYDGSYQALMHTQSNAGQNMHKDMLKAWTKENPNNEYPRMDGNTLVGQTAVDRFLISSNYLCLNNAQIGYTFPKKWMQRLNVGSLRIYVAGENLFLLTARQGIDPRYSFGLGSYTSGSGLNTGGYSNMRNITGGISLTF